VGVSGPAHAEQCGKVAARGPAGMKIGQMCFFRLSSPAEKPPFLA
jgi:hypothetical protein